MDNINVDLKNLGQNETSDINGSSEPRSSKLQTN